MKKRAIAYVDGFNLHFGLKAMRWPHYYWLDVPRVIRRLLGPGYELQLTKYFTARVSDPAEKVHRQNEYLEALAGLPNVQMLYGVYQTHARRCRSCGAEWAFHSEKMTDVNIAVEILSDAYRQASDSAVVLSADSDLAPVLAAVRTLFPEKHLVVMFPPARGSVRLGELAHERRRVREWIIRESQLPDETPGLDGYPKRRPDKWSLGGE